MVVEQFADVDDMLQMLNGLLQELETSSYMPHDALFTFIQVEYEIAEDGQALAYLFSQAKNPLPLLSKTVAFFKRYGGYNESYSLQFLNNVPRLLQQGTEFTLKRVLNFFQYAKAVQSPDMLAEELMISSQLKSDLLYPLDRIFTEMPYLPVPRVTHQRQKVLHSTHVSVMQYLEALDKKLQSKVTFEFISYVLMDLAKRTVEMTQSYRYMTAALSPGQLSQFKTVRIKKHFASAKHPTWNRIVIKGLFYDRLRNKGVVRPVIVSFSPGTGIIKGALLDEEAKKAIMEARQAALGCLRNEFGTDIVTRYERDDLTIEIGQEAASVLCEGRSLGLAAVLALFVHVTGQPLYSGSENQVAVTGQIVIDESGVTRVSYVDRDTLKYKIQAALQDKTISRIIIPYDNRSDTPLPKGTLLIRNLNELLDVLFPFEPISDIPLGISGEHAISLARKIIISQHHHYFGTPHLFLGLCAYPYSYTQTLLKQAGIEINALQQEILRALSPGPLRKRIPITQRCRTNLIHAVEEAHHKQSTHVEEGHLLSAILRNRSGITIDALRRQNVDPEVLLNLNLPKGLNEN